MSAIHEKLLQIQTKLKCNKGQYNSFGKYHYRNAEDILEAVKPLLAETKTTLTLFDEVVDIADRVYIKSTARLTDTVSSEHIGTTAYAREPENKKGLDESQITGSTSSYARKYALNGLFSIDDTKDSDYAPEPKLKPQKALTKGTRGQINAKIVEYAKLANKDVAEITEELQRVAQVPLQEITDAQGQQLLAYLDEKIDIRNLSK